VSKRMKVLVSVLAATLLLIVGGTMAVLAHDGPAPGARAGMSDIIARVAEKLGIEAGDLQTAFDEVRSEIRAENPDGRFGMVPFRAPMTGVAESLGVEPQALHDAFTQAWGELRDGDLDDKAAVTARVAEILGIEQSALEDAFTQARSARGGNPDAGAKFGFRGHRGFPGMRGPCAPAE